MELIQQQLNHSRNRKHHVFLMLRIVIMEQKIPAKPIYCRMLPLHYEDCILNLQAEVEVAALFRKLSLWDRVLLPKQQLILALIVLIQCSQW